MPSPPNTTQPTAGDSTFETLQKLLLLLNNGLRLSGSASEWVNANFYETGEIVLASDGNAYLARDDGSGNNPVSDDGANWGLLLVSENVTLSVPGRFATIAAAWAFLEDAHISSAATVAIQVADGTHTISARATFNHPSGDRIAILGNTTTAANCVLSCTGLTSPGANDSYVQKTDGVFSVSDGHTLGLLDGFKIVGPGVATGLRLTGVLAFGNSAIFCGAHMWVTDFGRCFAAIDHSTIRASGCRASNGGDGNIFAYDSSLLIFEDGISEGAGTFNSMSGACIEFNSTLWAPDAIFRLSTGCQVAADFGSSLMLDRATFQSGGAFDSAPAVKCFGGLVHQQRVGCTFTNCSDSLYEVNVDSVNSLGRIVFGFRTASEANFGEFAFVGISAVPSISLTVPNVASLFLGFVSTTATFATDGAAYQVKVSSSKALGGTVAFTATAKGLSPVQLASDPSGPTEGPLYYNTTSHVFKYWNGSAWKTLTAS